MEKRYIAKTYPNKESIQEHTDRLMHNFKILKSLYPKLRVDWDILELACLYHDLGKMNKKFQDKIKRIKVKNEIPHGFLSVGFLDVYKLEEKYKGKEEKIKILVNSIAYHHERQFRFSEHSRILEEEIIAMRNEAKNFKYDKIPNCFKTLNVDILDYLDGSRVTEEDGEDVFYQYILVKGLLNRIDYVSSAGNKEKVEWENNFLEKTLNKMMEDKGYRWNKLQGYMIKNKDKNIIAIAQTGMGKTEAGLLWIGNSKGFFTLPIKIAINSIYDRIRKDIVKEKLEERVGLLHSDTFNEYIKREDAKEDKLELEEIGLSEYYDRTKLLSLPITISTLDQLFDFVYRYKGFELKLATLSYSKIVIDEIQMYSPELVAYLIYGLKLITNIGGKFSILTATFPPIFEELLIKEKVEYIKPQPFIEGKDKIRHSIKVMDELISPNFIAEQSKQNNKVLVICNTIKTAQELYKTLKGNPELENLNLIHSYFTKKDRSIKEKDILELGKKDSKGKGIWIGTQILEASLDIDFDVLITELSDINGLFQRLGRCYRKRYFNLDNGYNAYVFTGGGKRIRGIGFVVDKKIFEISKEAIKELDGPLSESKKLEIINSAYTMGNLSDTEYLEKIEGTMDYLKSIYTNEKTKKEVIHMFRNINNISIIPRIVYKNNKVEIEQNIDVLRYNGEIKHSREEKSKARSILDKFKISIPYYSFKFNNNNIVEINQYEYLNIYKCNYKYDIGFTNVIEDELDETSNMM